MLQCQTIKWLIILLTRNFSQHRKKKPHVNKFKLVEQVSYKTFDIYDDD